MSRFFYYVFDELELEQDLNITDNFFSSFQLNSVIPNMSAAPIELPLYANIDGTPGDDTLNGSADADTINGFAGNDVINGYGGDDILNGGDDDDVIGGGNGENIINGGAGNDIVTYSDQSLNAQVNLDTGIGTVNGTTLEVIAGTTTQEVLTAAFASNIYINVSTGANPAGEYRDQVEALIDDTTDANGIRTVVFSLTLNSANVVPALPGSFGFHFGTITFTVDATGAVTYAMSINFNNETDITSVTLNEAFVNATGPVVEDVLADPATTLKEFSVNDTLIGIESVVGGAGADTITGNDAANVLEGMANVDTLFGGLGDDILRGGEGNDDLNGGVGADILDGGNGFDTVFYDNSDAGVTVNLLTGLSMGGSAEGDQFFSIEAIRGSEFDDILTTGNDRSNLEGGEGDDILTGGDELNVLVGGALFNNSVFVNTGNDMLFGGGGDDQLLGGDGADHLDGGDGVDTAFYHIGVGGGVNIDLFTGTATGGDAEGDTLVNIENVWGSRRDDIIVGDNLNNELRGNNGNDNLNGEGGDDTLIGGIGDDTIDGGIGTDYAIYNGDQSDYTITDNMDGTYTVVDNVFNEGMDTLSNVEIARFDDGDVFLSGAPPIEGTSGNDNLMGTVDNDVINGLAGNDILEGLAGDDTLNGGDGADRLIGGQGADVLNGGTGFDTADYRGATSGVRFNVDTGGTLGEALGDTFAGIERYYLSDFNDIVTGSNANEFFYGEDGNDQINGGGGIDRIYGGDGDDIQRGQDGNDSLYGSAGADQLNGGVGFDIARYDNAVAGVIVNMLTGGTGGDAAGDTYFGIEAVYGSDFDDSITGNNSSNELRGGDGDDALFGLGGNDRFFGGDGADSFDGGSGIDIVNYTLATGSVELHLMFGGEQGEAAGDSYSSIEWVYGSEFGDGIVGTSAANRIEGRGGSDSLDGGGGNDRILGGTGDDYIVGGDGNDTLFGQEGDDGINGGLGNDFLYGGAGADGLDGGAGFDTVNYLSASEGVGVSMVGFGVFGEAAGDSYESIERVIGTSFDDILVGSLGDDTLLGGGGNDYLEGGGGTTTLIDGNDTLIGGAGIDSYGYHANAGGQDVIYGFASNELIYMLSDDPLFDTYAEVMSYARDVGSNVFFDFIPGIRTLTLVGVTIADLSEANFDFSRAAPAGNDYYGPSFEGELLSDPDAFAEDIGEVFNMDALI